MPATMSDVAEQAGVSVTTVSHVINNTRPVSEDLRGRVVLAMAALNYQPNRLARSLRQGRTHTLGMIVPDNANPYFAEVARGIEETAYRNQYSLILCNSEGDVDRERFYINVLLEKQVDGLILVAAGSSTSSIADIALPPMVVVDRDLPNIHADAVLTENAQGGRLATGHLLALGHRRIACITGASDVTSAAERATGYRQALVAAGVAVDESLVVKAAFDYASGYAAAKGLLTCPNPPTAIFACNDLMAVGAISAGIELGLRIPADLSIVGFDDVQLASFANPPLTTVAQPKREMGDLAVSLLLERMVNPAIPPRRRWLGTELVVRGSTSMPSAQ